MFYDIDWGQGPQQGLQPLQNTRRPDLWNLPQRPAVVSYGTGTELPGQRLAQLGAGAQPQLVDPAQRAAMFAGQALQNNPIFPGMDDSEIAAAQIARDSSGDVRRIMESMQGIKRLPPPLTVAEQRSMPQQPPLQSFRPEGGFGGIPTEESMRSTLDLRIAQHPEFLKVASKDPKRAAYAYKAMTGRDYDEDVKVHTKITANRDRFNVDTVQKLIKDGAYVDSTSGKLMVWDYVETPPGIGSLTGEAKAVRKLVPASPDLQQMWKDTYSRVTGRADPMVEASQVAGKTARFEQNNALLKQYADVISAKEQEASRKLGRPVTFNAKDKSDIIRDLLRAEGDAGQAQSDMAENHPATQVGEWEVQAAQRAYGNVGNFVRGRGIRSLFQ